MSAITVYKPPGLTVSVLDNVVVPPPAPASDFDARKAATGVVRWFDFDNVAQLGGGYGANFGTLPGKSTAPVIDTAIKASGNGSLRFDVPSLSGSDAAGSWFANFSANLGTQFGENTEFYIQWRQRFNQAFIDTLFKEIGGGIQGGIKQAIITTGDQAGKLYNSCEAIGNVVQSYYQHRFPIVYNSCTGSASHPAYEGMYQPVGSPPADFLLQNGTAPFCKYSAPGATPVAVGAGCFGWVADEWMTFQMAISMGPRVGNEFSQSRTRLWGARAGQASVLLVDWKPGMPGYWPLAAGPAAENQRFGKIWLLPYMTNKDATQVHALAQTWYDELIISTQPIADPGGVTPTPVPNPTPIPIPPPTPVPPLANLPANTALDLGRYTCNQPADNPNGCERISEYSGFRFDPIGRRMLQFGGGHASTTRTDIGVFDLATLKWGSLYASTPCSAQTFANADLSKMRWISTNHPHARHTYGALVVSPQAFYLMSSGGLDHVEGCGGTNLGGAGASQPRISRYDLATGAWTYSARGFPWYYASAAAFDPVSGKIVVMSGYNSNVGPGSVWVYDPATDTIVTGGPVPVAASYGNNLVYYPPNQKFYAISNGGTGGCAVFEVTLNRASPAQSAAVQVTGMTGTLPALAETGFAYDSKNNVIGGGVLNGKFYTYDPATKQWTMSVMLTTPSGAVGTVAHHSLDYDPVNNVFIILTDYASGFRTWAYRYK